MKEQFEVSAEEKAAWREREKARFRVGAYTVLPDSWRYSNWFCDRNVPETTWPDGTTYWHPPRFPHHFAHISVDKVAMVAFTENDQKGVRDRQTRMSPGRYLAKFYSEWLDHEEIRDLATQMGAEYDDDSELFFAKTADEIERVYKNGPNSCMDGRHNFDSDVHPTRVYAGFDLELAYLKRKGNITARALCWPEKKIYSRVYGDATRLEKALHDLNFKQKSLDGARITRLMHDEDTNTYVIPYLDGLAGAQDKGDHLVLRADRSHDLCCKGDCQNGLSSTCPDYHCYNCGDDIDEGEQYTDDGGEAWCRSCFTSNHWQCERTGEYFHNDGCVGSNEVLHYRNRNGRYGTQIWSEHEVSDHAFYCNRDDVYYADTFRAYDMHNGETWGPQAFEREGGTCEATHEHYPKDELVTLETGQVWCDGYFADNGVTIDGKHYAEDDQPDEYDGLTPSQRTAIEAERLRVAADFAQTELGQSAQPIVAGCMVECSADSWGSPNYPPSFTRGGIYKVTRVDGGGTVYIERDNNGMMGNGWDKRFFRFHSMPRVPEDRSGWHIRHEPDAGHFQYRLYNGDNWINGWSTMALAQNGLERYRQAYERDSRPVNAYRISDIATFNI